MKELLQEFLSNLLNETREAHKPGTVWQVATSKKWSAKRTDGTTQSGFSSQKAAKAWLAGGRSTSKPDVQTKSKVRSKDVAKKKPQKIVKTKSTSPKTPVAAASAMLRATSDVTGKLISAVKGFRDNVYKFGAVGTGTEDSTKGEQSSCTSSEDFIGGHTIQFEGNNIPVPGGVTDEMIENQRQAVRAGRGGKNLSEYEVTNRAIERAWMEVEKQRYVDGGSNPPNDEWLKAAYRSGLSTRAILEQRADMTITQAALRDGTIPPPMVTDEGPGKGKEAAENYLKGLRDATVEGSDDRAHFDKLLLALATAEDTDTCAFYIRKDGRPSVLFISNKQGLNDPHGNTGPKARITRIASLAATSGLDEKGQEGLKKAIETARAAIGASVGDATATVKEHFDKQRPEDQVAADQRLRELLTGGLPADRGRIKDYTGDILEFPPVKKTMRDLYCQQNGNICKDKKPKEIDAVIEKDEEFKLANIGTAFRMAAQENPGHSGVRKILIKLGSVGTGPNDAKLLGPVLQVGSNMKAAAADAHSTIVEQVHTIDKQQCGNSWDDTAKACIDNNGNPTNGPATQTYVDAFMRDTHWDQYMCTDGPNDDCSGQAAVNETKLVDINGHKVPPAKFRQCLANLTGFTAKGDDPDSPDNQRALWSHLKRSLKVDSEEDSISVHGDGRQIGKEKYRTKGASASLLTYLGKDMGKCVSGA